MKDYADYLDDEEHDPADRRSRGAGGGRRPKRRRAEGGADEVEPVGNAEAGFNPSFGSSRHERAWILTYLGPFYDELVIADVLRQVKGGKEANVYCCAAHPSTGVDLIAAKVYRPRMFRNLANDALYREGRDVLDVEGKGVRDRRRLLAMRKRTDFGQEVLHTSWLANEYQTMRLLAEAGADVPRPLAHSDNAILMEYIGEEGWPAPTLNQVRLRNVELFLARDRIHTDLSAHNVLYWAGEVRIIDFPQAVGPFVNPHAYALLTRDVERLCQYFARYGIVSATDAPAITRDIWQRCIPTAEVRSEK